jgi:hypothetical protein
MSYMANNSYIIKAAVSKPLPPPSASTPARERWIVHCGGSPCLCPRPARILRTGRSDQPQRRPQALFALSAQSQSAWWTLSVEFEQARIVAMPVVSTSLSYKVHRTYDSFALDVDFLVLKLFTWEVSKRMRREARDVVDARH